MSFIARLKKKAAATPTGTGARNSGPKSLLLRERLVLFAWVGAGFALLRLLIHTITSCDCAPAVMELFFENPEPIFMTLVVAGGFLLMGAIAKWVPLSRRGLSWLDRVGILGTMAGAPALACLLDLGEYHSTQPVFAVILIIMWRASIVPSHALNTLGLSALLALLSQAPAFFFRHAEAEAVLPYATRISWLVVAILIAATTSGVIYRLHRRSRAAEALGQYTLEKKLGSGGMGDVFLARHALMCRPVA
ncbi:MAG: hypothetical protein V3W41_16865, partial [Planctomycetota bacterium]